MNRNIGCVFISLTAAILLIFCVSFAEVYDDPDMCFSLTQDGWIRDIVNVFEIRASETNLYEFDAFSTLTFAGELGKADFDISVDPAKPYDRALIFFDTNTFEPVEADTGNPVRVVMGAYLDPDKTDHEKYLEYVSLKNSVIGSNRELRNDILVWANILGKQIPVEGIFWFMDIPEIEEMVDISKYGAVLDYMTRFVSETKQSGLEFREMFSAFETGESGRFNNRNTRYLTGRGYSIGLIADPDFVFLTAAGTDAVLFRDSESVTEYYEKICMQTGFCGRK